MKKKLRLRKEIKRGMIFVAIMTFCFGALVKTNKPLMEDNDYSSVMTMQKQNGYEIMQGIK